MWEGCPLPTDRGVWGPPPKNFAFGSKNGEFWCILDRNITLELLDYRLH